MLFSVVLVCNDVMEIPLCMIAYVPNYQKPLLLLHILMIYDGLLKCLHLVCNQLSDINSRTRCFCSISNIVSVTEGYKHSKDNRLFYYRQRLEIANRAVSIDK